MGDIFDNLDNVHLGRYARFVAPTPQGVTPRRKATPKALSRLYFRVQWNRLAEAMNALGTDRATRLWLLLSWQTRVSRTSDGWVPPQMYMLEKIGLRDGHCNDVVRRLEKLGLVEVQRRPYDAVSCHRSGSSGKRPLLRLTNKSQEPA
jgi:DNA-binding MarR family transcriptional regulator